MKIFLPSIISLFTLLVSFSAAAQDALIRGKLTDSAGEPVTFAYVYLKDTRAAATSDKNGAYVLRSRPGTYTVVASALGYKTREQEIEIGRGERLELDIVMEQDVYTIDNVRVEARSPVQQVRESSYNVIAIDAAALHNTSLDVAHALDRVSGVKIRERGGVGSETSLYINGFTGRHVKIFMDGIPMDGRGSSFGINNIPVGMAERIEIYKGVVPVELGTDAMGGAVNIVTRKTANTYVDASYSFGSFNTHRSNISFGHVTARGFVVQLNAYQNYSDNNYKVKSQLLYLDDERYNTWSEESYWFKRFHDMYRNEAVTAKIGVTGKKWADRLLVGATLSQEKDEIQNSNIMRIVYGGRFTRSKTVSPSATYEKRNLFVRNLDLSLSANYNRVHSNNVDTMSRKYNWLGEYRRENSKGEGESSLREFNNNNYYVTGNLRYNIGGRHYISFNNVYSSFWRKATDSEANLETVTEATFMKRSTDKNVMGLSYKYSAGERANITAFGKYYDIRVKGPQNVSEGSSTSYEMRSRSFNTIGYGAAATYRIIEPLQVKISFEQAYRLPGERELFGDEVLEKGDMTLKPENSRNINFNLNYNGHFAGGHNFYLEAGISYRDIRDYIRRIIEQSKGGAYYTNHGKVRNVGIDMEARYFWQGGFTAGVNLTYLDMRNLERFSPTGQELIYYRDRMPNVPYFFGNVDASYDIRNVFCRGSVLTLGYNLNYFHEFYLNWQSEGAGRRVPGQLSQDVSVTYSFKDARYNVAFEVNNITGELLYDNYSLQKPGRNYNVKLRYFFFKSRETPKEKVKPRRGHGRKNIQE